MVVEPGPLGRGDQFAGDGIARNGVVELDGARRSPDQAPMAAADTGLLDGPAQGVQAPLGHDLGGPLT